MEVVRTKRFLALLPSSQCRPSNAWPKVRSHISSIFNSSQHVLKALDCTLLSLFFVKDVATICSSINALVGGVKGSCGSGKEAYTPPQQCDRPCQWSERCDHK